MDKTVQLQIHTVFSPKFNYIIIGKLQPKGFYSQKFLALNELEKQEMGGSKLKVVVCVRYVQIHIILLSSRLTLRLLPLKLRTEHFFQKTEEYVSKPL
eukprot:snap_masked-scaffold_4-processed-gene-16.39-mRNA-1 protein AED:1.00 eAED:1.00 QI:0/0/0/0/1/1/2/0/97